MKENQSCKRILADTVLINECKNRIQKNSIVFNQTSSLLALAGNEVRLKILYLIEEENELCPCDLADILEMSIPAVSQHLRKMKDGKLIKTRRSGQTIFYSLIKEQTELLIPFFKSIQNSNKQVV
ncbi:ArsR/SmtB family transcription factor [Flavobacterium bizetiae]|uniref:ArsR/SmtB family transcription factor n=1 Tax=Flavobacterium bizetiae TaxID=2704140 RepID=UPI003757C154